MYQIRNCGDLGWTGWCGGSKFSVRPVLLWPRPGFAYEPSYAYVAPALTYAAPVYGYVYAPPPVCWNSTSDSRNYGYYGSCVYGAIDTDAEKLGQARPNRRLVR